MKRSARRPIRKLSRGIALIEALVSILLFSIGILGLVGLQGAMARNQSDAHYRTVAAFLANDLIGRAWSDKPNLAKYATDSSGACISSSCINWKSRVEQDLPKGGAAVAVDAATGLISVTLSWAMPDGSHKYTTSTIVQ